MRTKHEESSTTSATRTSNSPGLTTTTVSISPPARSEIRWYLGTIRLTSFLSSLTGDLSLQDLEDLRQLFTSYPGPFMRRNDDPNVEIANALDKALSAVVQETMVWAQQHEADGRYRDAEYLFRRASSNESISADSLDPYQNEHVLPTLVSLYEKMGDCPAAEIAQEALLTRLFATNSTQTSDAQTRAVCAYSNMLFNFGKRIHDLNPDYLIVSPSYIDSFDAYRAAVLDIIPLNEILLEQVLCPIGPYEKKEGDPLLHIAAKGNAVNLARRLIEMGADINSRDPNSRTPLHIAAEHAKVTMIELLLANHADIQAVDNSNRTPLHAALEWGKPAQAVVTILINAKVEVNAMDLLGTTALVIAIERDLPAMARLLLEQGADVEGSAHFRETPLFTAVRQEREWATKLLLENGADLTGMNAYGETALFVAVVGAHESIIQILLDHGAMTKITVDQQNHHEETVLNRAVRAGSTSITEMLLKAGADISARDSNGYTALHQAIEGGREAHEHTVRLLLSRCAPLDAVNCLGYTIFHVAVMYRRVEMIQILVHNIRPEILLTTLQTKDSLDRTPLDVARALAKKRKNSSVERSVSCLLENTLELSRPLLKIMT